MTQEVILGIIRHILTFGGGLLVTRGIADTGTIEVAAGAIVTLVGAVWSVIQKKQAAK